MNELPEEKRPFWVAVALWGSRRRAYALVWLWISLLMAVGGAVAGAADVPPLFAGTLFLIPAWWYWAAIRWTDRRKLWEK